MYAILETGVKQYRVKEGDKLQIDKIPGDVGSKVTLNSVLMVKKDNDVLVGTPKVANAKIEGTIVHEMLTKDSLEKMEVRLGHPGGVIPVGVKMLKRGISHTYEEAVVNRTARRLMDGYVHVPERHFKKGREK